jgi:glycosyltransferase involved in cell wall biosynthesis
MIPATRFRHPVNLWRTTSGVRNVIRRERIHIVHGAMAFGHLYGALARIGTRARGVWFQQAAVNRPGLIDRLAAAAPSAWIFANSEASAQAQRSLWNRTGGISVVHLGVDLKEFSLDRTGEADAVRRDLGIAPDHLVVGMAGRFEPWKGQHIFLEAAAQLVERFPQAIFLVVGGALFGLGEDYKARLEAFVRERQLDSRVRFVGFREDMSPVYAAMDVAVHASTSPEPFGLVIVEAMAMGRPVIASDAGGPREILEDGVTGLLSPVANSKALAERIALLLVDPERRRALGAAARKRVEAAFSAEVMTTRVEEVYRQIVDREGARRARLEKRS